MVQKPKIQYVGQFYVHGSEARQLELEQEHKKKVKDYLPERLQKIEKVYVDPVAIIAIAVSAVMLVTMAVGAMQLQKDWDEYERVSSYVSELKKENAKLEKEYRAMYDLNDIKSKALALGLVPKEEIQTVTVTVTVPEKEPVPSKIEEIKWFLEGLFA